MYRPKVIFLFFISITTASDLPTVKISNGLVQGSLKKSYNGRTFAAFEGIPYAKPPIGEKRFQSPEEPYNWTGTWIANTQHTCLQYMWDIGIMGNEDCLYINVYVPRSNPDSADSLNVIVHIHGGAYMFGSANYYAGPKYLMDEEVIYVAMNHRLGPLGFLSTGDEVVPGNNGLKDQVLALRWIQKNIKHFGGNPDSVTITGMSSGASSVHFHYFSPLSKGLFHRGVSQSGAALNPWAVQELMPERAKHLGKVVGCSKNTSRDLIECLRSRSGDQIVGAVKNIQTFDGFPAVLFGPVIEKQSNGAFLTTHPYKMLIDKTVLDVPWVASVTPGEGAFVAYAFTKDILKIVEHFDNIAPHLLEFDADIENSLFGIKQIKQHYIKHNEDREGAIRLLGDRYFIAGAGQSAKLQAKANKSPVYFYIFDYRGQNSFTDYFLPNTTHIGASHGDDVLYYLHGAVAKEPLSPSDEKMKTVFLKWLINYANNQEPKIDEVTWNSVTGGEHMEYLHVKGPNEIYMDSIDDLGFSTFWNKLALDGFPDYVIGKTEL